VLDLRFAKAYVVTSMSAFFAAWLEPLPSLSTLSRHLSTMVPSFIRRLTGLLTLQSALIHAIPHNPWPSQSPPKLEPGHLGAVASESEICSHIGTGLLKQGGNAADALVGTVFCIGVIGM
jgi:gamma-glutamyltranspeptidase / glutathione hydrolase